MIYFDTSFIVPYFLPEVASKQVEAFLRQLEGGLTLSQWTRTEFVSAVGIKCRTGQISSKEADLALERFQDIISTYFSVLVPQEQDFTLAASFLRSWSLGLRAGDALHLAIASNHRAERLYSLDKTMISAAEFLSIPASKGI